MADVVTCKDCKHWGKPHEYTSGIPQGWRECAFMEMMDQMVSWGKDSQNHLVPEYKDHKAAVMDGSSYYAGLLTAPDFFCYHGDKKL